jgi:hypothetical protein
MKRGQEGPAPPQAAPTGPKLLNRRDIDVPDDLESAWKSCWTELQNKISNASEAEAVGFLQMRVRSRSSTPPPIIMFLSTLFEISASARVHLLTFTWRAWEQAGEGPERHSEVIMGLLFSVFTVPQVSMLVPIFSLHPFSSFN